MLTDFQNYFTTEKGIKFATNPVIFRHILNMFLYYLGELSLKVRIYREVQQINLKIVSHLSKMKL